MPNPKYDSDFKKSIVALHQSGKSQSQISRDYGVSLSAINKWIKQYSEVKIDDDTILSAKQIKELQKRNALLEEENLILKKAHNFCYAKTTSSPTSFGIKLPYSRHKETEIRCYPYFALST